MSDPVTNTEIEDVLSSIRRLVSEEGRRPARRASKPVALADKLVLTPALRVGFDDTTGAEDAAETTDRTDEEAGSAAREPEVRLDVDRDAPWKDPQVTLFQAADALSDDEPADMGTEDATAKAPLIDTDGEADGTVPFLLSPERIAETETDDTFETDGQAQADDQTHADDDAELRQEADTDTWSDSAEVHDAWSQDDHVGYADRQEASQDHSERQEDAPEVDDPVHDDASEPWDHDTDNDASAAHFDDDPEDPTEVQTWSEDVTPDDVTENLQQERPASEAFDEGPIHVEVAPPVRDAIEDALSAFDDMDDDHEDHGDRTDADVIDMSAVATTDDEDQDDPAVTPMAEDDIDDDPWQAMSDGVDPGVLTPDAPNRLASDAISDLTAKIAELEAKIGGPDGYFEPDEPGTDPYSAAPLETMGWEDHVARKRMTQNSAEADDALREAEESNADLLGLDETVLDEESLRELVADIVRQELMGALGERITRNVRKLVRREINRALAAQDFD